MNARRNQAGYTLVEVMVGMFIMSLAVVAIMKFANTVSTGLQKQEATASMEGRTLRMASNLRALLQTNRVLVANYPANNPPLGALGGIITQTMGNSQALSLGVPVSVTFVADATVQNTDVMNMAGGAVAGAAWGNRIMFLSQLSPVTLTVYNSSVTNVATTTATTVSLGRSQFVCIYIGYDTARVPVMLRPALPPNDATGFAGSPAVFGSLPPIPGIGQALRLTVWRSQVTIDYADINNGTIPQQVSECAALKTMGYGLAFDLTSPGTGAAAFWAMSPTASLTVDPLVEYSTAGSVPLSTQDWAYMDDFDYALSQGAGGNGAKIGRITRAGVMSEGRTAAMQSYSLAYNSAAGSTGPHVNTLVGRPGLVVPQYAALNSALPGFPAGFEVGIGGRTNSREIFCHITEMVANSALPTSGPLTFMANDLTTEITVNSEY